jgi:hypothetical protein
VRKKKRTFVILDIEETSNEKKKLLYVENMVFRNLFGRQSPWIYRPSPAKRTLKHTSPFRYLPTPSLLKAHSFYCASFNAMSPFLYPKGKTTHQGNQIEPTHPSCLTLSTRIFARYIIMDGRCSPYELYASLLGNLPLFILFSSDFGFCCDVKGVRQR